MIQIPLISQDTMGTPFGFASLSNELGVFRSNEFGDGAEFIQREADLR